METKLYCIPPKGCFLVFYKVYTRIKMVQHLNMVLLQAVKLDTQMERFHKHYNGSKS